MPIHNNRCCSNTLYIHEMDVRCSLKWFTASTIVYWLHLQMSSTYNISQLYKTRGNICGGIGMSMRVYPHAHPQLQKVIIHFAYV